jgi:hypothetical protein
MRFQLSIGVGHGQSLPRILYLPSCVVELSLQGCELTSKGVDFHYGPLVSGYLGLEGYISFHTDCLIDKRCEALSIIENKLFLMCEKRFQIGMRLGMEWDGLDETITSLSNQDGGILVLHVNVVKRSWMLFLIIKKGKLRKFERSVYQILIPQESWVDSRLGFIVVI